MRGVISTSFKPISRDLRDIPALRTLDLFENTLVFSEVERRKIFERLLRSNLADILTPLVTMTRKWSSLAYVQRDFDQL